MTNSEVIPAKLLQRKAVVYVRQSSPAQVVTNLESQRLQYDLAWISTERNWPNNWRTQQIAEARWRLALGCRCSRIG